MKNYPDGHFDLAVVDPPYGIGESKRKREHRTDRWKNPPKKQHNPKDWDNRCPDESYFQELIRVSKNQIIWGANHFIERIPNANSSCWLVWDKKNGESDFSDCELAWTSFDTAVRMFSWLWNGFQKQQPEHRIHPTQKPVALYDWIFDKYAKAGDKILDTHLGSQSSRIAAWKHGLDFTGFELDEDYFREGCKRFDNFAAQQRLF